jgi:ketosteroid isomerase-like protein
LADTVPDAIERACQRLVIEFAEAIDAQDYERLREVFAPDATFARPTEPDTVIRGIDSIIAAYAARPRNRLTQHLCTNIRVTAESDDAARGTCVVLLFLGDASEPDRPGKGRRAAPSQLLGTFADRFQRTEDGWRIAERRGRLLMHT